MTDIYRNKEILLMFVVLLIGALVEWWIDDPKILGALGFVVAVGAFFNNRTLSKRLDKMHGIFTQRGITNESELISDQKTRRLFEGQAREDMLNYKSEKKN